MRSLGFAALLVAIVAVAQTNSPVNAGESKNGNKIYWSAGFPKLNSTLGVEPVKVGVQFDVTIATGWSGDRVDYNITRFREQNGTGWLGSTHYSITSNLSGPQEQTLSLPIMTGKSIKVTSNSLTASLDSNPTQTDIVNEADSGLVVIRN